MAKNRSLVLRQTPVWAQGVALVVVGLGTVAVVAASIFRIDEVVSVQGRLIPSLGSSIIKSPVSGKLSDVFVKNGDFVRTGQKVALFDTQKALTDIATFKSLIRIEKQSSASKLKIYEKRKEVLENKLKTNNYILQSLKDLVETGGFQRIQYLNKLDEIYELENQLESVLLEAQRSKLEAEKTFNQYSNALQQSELLLKNQSLVSNIDGLVFDTSIRSGNVVKEGEVLLTIIPQTGLKALVNVSNRDIGFVKVGQPAAVRVDAFSFSTFGELQGQVLSVSADVKEPSEQASFYSFPVVIKLDKNYLETNSVRIPLKSGMSIQANLRLRDKPVISLLSDLLVDKTESLKSIRQ